MTDDPWKRLSNLPIDPFKPHSSGGGSGFNTGDVITTVKTGWQLGRHWSAGATRRRVLAAGYDPITADAAAEAVKAGRDPAAILAAADQARAARNRQADLLNHPPPVHGSAAWAEADELIAANLLLEQEPDHGAGLVLGQVAGQPLYWQGESHLLTVAPTRTGKATTQIIPNLLRYRGSAVVLDPKGELAAQTAAWRAANVGPVYLLNPFDLPSPGLPAASYNPLDFVKTEQDATKLAEMLYPRTDDDRQRFFDNEAISFLSAVVLFFARYVPPEHRNFGVMRDRLAALGPDFDELLSVMREERFPPSIRNAAANVVSKTRDIGQPRLMDSLNQHLRVWDTPGLRRTTATTDFDFGGLKDEPATVYLMLPFEEISTYGTFVQLIFAAALNGMLTNPRQPEIPVLFVLDEFLALEPDDRFVSALRTHASAGARLWFFLQDLPTLEQKYPQTWKSFLQVEAKMFFGTDDPYTAELISDYLGDQTVSYTTGGETPGVSGGSASYSIQETVQLTGRPLLKPDEVIRLLSTTDASQPRTGVHFLRGVRPVQVRLTPWFHDPVAVGRTQEPDHA